MKNLLLSYALASLFVSSVPAQGIITIDLDGPVQTWSLRKGSTTVMEQGAFKGKALRLDPGTTVVVPLALQASSTYKVSARLRTESGADAITLQIDKLGRNNISVTVAMANWTLVERDFQTDPRQTTGELLLEFDQSQGDTHAWVDEIVIERTGDRKEVRWEGIPPAPQRVVKMDRGIAMQPDRKMTWMLDGKLGLFIHWGLYAGPGQGEWYMEKNGILPEVYRKLAYPEAGDEYFDATAFDATHWAELAKKMGARYMNMVTQHHDGYALFSSKYPNAFTSEQTHGRDFVKAFVTACRKAGLRVGLYKTLINWRYPGYYDVTGTHCETNRFHYTTDSAHKENARMMKEELYCQVKELMTRYGKIDQLFWDGGWLAQRGTDADGAYFWESGKFMSDTSQWPVHPQWQDKDTVSGKPLGLMGMVRKYQPDILVNPRSGWIGDYTCEEGGGPVKGNIRHGVVEKCMTIGPGWGYSKKMEDPERITPLPRIKRILADCLVRNMSLLVNIGPDRHGNVPPLVEQRLLEFGDWVKRIAVAVYGTRGGPWEPVDGQYGYCHKGNIIYIYLLGEYASDTFSLPAVKKGMRVLKAYDVESKALLKTSQQEEHIKVEGIRPKAGDITVLAVEMDRRIR